MDQIRSGARGGGGTPPEQSSAAAARRSSPRVVLRGSLRPVLGSGASSVLRVMHLGQNRVRRGSARRAWLPRRLCAAELAGAVRAGCACARLWRKGIRKALRSKCKTTRLTRGGVVLRRRGHGGAAAGDHRRQCSANRVAHGPNFLAKKEARGSRVLTEGLRWTKLRRSVVIGEVRAVVAGGARGEGRCRGWSGVQRP